jgi:sugar lactone lactonase YvrE
LIALLAGYVPLQAQNVTGLSVQDFGTVALGANNAIAIQYQVTGASAQPKILTRFGVEFTAGTAVCSGTTTLACTVPVTFSPQHAGVRQDAILVENGSTLLFTTFLHGIGAGAQLQINPGTARTAAGEPGFWGYAGDGGQATSAWLANPQGVAVDAAGNLYVADTLNQVVREIDHVTGLIKTVAGTPYVAGYSGDGAAATKAALNSPVAVAIDGAGDIFIADYGNDRVRRVDGVSGIITTFAGGGTATGSDQLGDGGPATAARLHGPSDVAVDFSGNVYVADTLHNVVRMIAYPSGVISLVAGGGAGGGSDGFGDGGLGTSAILQSPEGIAVNASGDLFISDKGNNLVRVVRSATKIINVVAGNGGWGYAGDGGPALNAQLFGPWGVKIDPAGNVYIADSGNNVIREINSATGTISTLAGTGSTGYGGDGGSALGAFFSMPMGLAIDSSGSVYVADSGNNIVRRILPASAGMTFPKTFIGLASPQQFTAIANTGTAPVTVAALGVSTAFAQKPSGRVDCSASLAIAAGSSCMVSLTFNPSTAGVTTGTLTLSFGTSVAPAMISLSGTGAGSSGGQVTIAPASLNFGNESLGSTTAAQSVTLTNNTAGALAIANIWLAGANSSDFSMTTTCGSSLAAGSKCTISLTFTPSAAGARAGILTVSDNASNSPQVVTLAGSGQNPGVFAAGTLRLNQGQSLAYGTLNLVMGSDGNLILYQSGSPIWSTGTGGQSCGSSQCFAVFQSDGSLDVYNGSTLLWSSQTGGNPGAQLTFSSQSPQMEIVSNSSILWANVYSFSPANLWLMQGTAVHLGSSMLAMQADGNLVFYQNGVPLWSSGTWGQNCSAGQCFAVFQGDGNFVVYNGSTALWNSGTPGSGGQLVLSAQSPQMEVVSNHSILWANIYSFSPANLWLLQGTAVHFGSSMLAMQADGNLVFYQSGVPLWSSGTWGQNCSAGQCFAVFQGDGNFVVYNGSTPLWNSGTPGNPTAQLVLSSQPPEIEITAAQSLLWVN